MREQLHSGSCCTAEEIFGNCIDEGCFKYCYAFDGDSLIKLTADEETFEREKAIYEKAIEVGVDEIFIDSEFIRPTREISISTDEPLFACGAIIQPIASLCFDEYTETEFLCPDNPEIQSIFKRLGINAKEWLNDALSYYGIAKLSAFADFVEEYHIFDLHNGNLGYLDEKPIIFDWLSD